MRSFCDGGGCRLDGCQGESPTSIVQFALYQKKVAEMYVYQKNEISDVNAPGAAKRGMMRKFHFMLTNFERLGTFQT